MEPYHYWLIASAFLIMLELCTAGFGVICFAIGTLLSALVAYLEFGFEYQIAAFIAGSMIALFGIRPFALKWINKRKADQVTTNADAIIGRKATVVETIDHSTGTGYVKIDGDTWKAVSKDGSVIETGKEVTVTNIDSIILTVE